MRRLTVLALAAGLPAHNLIALMLLGFVGAVVYAGAIFALFGKTWIVSFGRTKV